MKISNSDLSLLLNQQKELLNLMQMNQESLIRIEKYLKMFFIHNIVCDYENIIQFRSPSEINKHRGPKGPFFSFLSLIVPSGVFNKAFFLFFNAIL